MSEYVATMPGRARGTAPARRRQATERVLRGVQSAVDRLSPEEVEALAARIEEVLAPPVLETDPFIADVSGGRAPGEQERLALAVSSVLRDFAFRRELLAGSLTAPQVATVLGTSRQTPHDRARASTLLAARDGGVLRFPAWQFDAAAPDGVIPGLPAAVRALGATPPLSKIAWFVTPKALLGRTPLEALKAGDLDEVLLAAETFATT